MSADPTERAGDQIAGAVGTERDWLAVLLLHCAEQLGNGIRRRLGMKRGERCPRCGHRY